MQRVSFKNNFNLMETLIYNSLGRKRYKSLQLIGKLKKVRILVKIRKNIYIFRWILVLKFTRPWILPLTGLSHPFEVRYRWKDVSLGSDSISVNFSFNSHL